MFQKALLNVPISSHPKEKQSVTDTLPMVMDVKELEKALCISRKTAYDLVKKPDFPFLPCWGSYPDQSGWTPTLD